MNKVSAMAKQRKIVKTVGEVIAAFGGTAKTAKRWDISPAAVSQWKAAGEIPTGHHCRMEHALAADGHIVDVKRLGWV
jgi:DNA-binding transcriptional regulator YdaS (Cro superfamily)